MGTKAKTVKIKNLKKKKALALEIIERLKDAYPNSDCTLDYNEAWKLLVSVRLAAQCTDARVNVVVKGLYEKFPTIEALADVRFFILTVFAFVPIFCLIF